MTLAIEQAIFTVSDSWALSTLVKATLVLALVLGGLALARRQRAAVRHAVLAVTFGVLLGLPVVAALAPPVRFAMEKARRPAAARGGSTQMARLRPGVGAVPASEEWPVAQLLFWGWLAGAVVFLVPAAVGLWQVRRLRTAATPWMAAGVEVLLHEGLAGPITCGSAILLPADAPEWAAEDLERAIVHEREHVTRRDWAIHSMARAVCSVYWFHPLVWMAWRRLELEAERACDDAVLGRSEATAYAEQLVAVARRLSAASKLPMLAMAGRADLGARVKSVLDGGQRRGPAGAWCVTAAVVAATALVATMSPLRLVAAPQTDASVAQFRTETQMVITAVNVLHASGTPMEGLSASDFTVTEDGVPQTVVFAEFHKSQGSGAPASYYTVGYYPSNRKADGKFRKLDVAVKTATVAKLEFREGYVGTMPAAAGPVGATTPPRSGLKPPALLFKKEPEYSEEARKAKYQGMVVLDVLVSESGQATDLRVVRSLGLGLDEKAVEAVRQWRFRPATQDGKPVAARTQVEVGFRLM